MAKHIHVSVPTYLYDKVMENKPYKNTSEWVQELLALGIEAKEKEMLKNKQENPSDNGPFFLSGMSNFSELVLNSGNVSAMIVFLFAFIVNFSGFF